MSLEDQIDETLLDWATQRPDLDTTGLGAVLRLQLLSKILLEQLTEQLATFGLEWWEYDVLAALRRQGSPYQMPAMEIAEKTRISPGAMTNRIDRLEVEALVARVEDPADRRRVLVQLTRKGRGLTDRATEARFAAAAEALQCLTEKQRKELDESLRLLVLTNDSRPA